MSEQNNMNSVQKVYVELLDEFQRVCKKHGFKYMAIYGTCIGTLRHHGFIPWDDDMDILMPLKDYLSFKKLNNSEFREGFEIFNPDEHEHFYMNALFFHNINTTAIDSNWLEYPDCYKGISIDVLPVSGLPKGRIKQVFQGFLLALWTIRNRMYRLPFHGQDGLAQKVMWVLSNATRRRGIPKNYYTKKIENHFSKYDFEESDKVMFLAKWRMKDKHSFATYYNIHATEDFVETIEMPFEYTTIPVPVGYDHYMKKEYGDYMKMPPAELQVSVHDKSVVRVDKS